MDFEFMCVGVEFACRDLWRILRSEASDILGDGASGQCESSARVALVGALEMAAVTAGKKMANQACQLEPGARLFREIPTSILRVKTALSLRHDGALRLRDSFCTARS